MLAGARKDAGDIKTLKIANSVYGGCIIEIIEFIENFLVYKIYKFYNFMFSAYFIVISS